MKVLFLDVDGVLNKEGTKATVETIFGRFTGLDQSLVNKLLIWLKEHEDVKVVLSSSWRLDGRFDHAFTNKLKEAGVTWIDETPNCGHRGEDIYQWYMDHPEVTHFAILDDTSDVHPVGKALVQTSAKTGLRDKDLKKLEELLSD